MSSGNETDRSVQDEVRKLIGMVRVIARTLGFSNAALARKADVPLASLVRYFKGEGEPKVEFLLAVLRALEIEPQEFFIFAYPAPMAQSEALARVERILGPIRPGHLLEPAPPPKPEPPAEPAPLPRQDIERMLEDLRRDVRELLENQARKDAGAEENARPRRKGEEE